MNSLFITGTDTDSGKTFVCAGIAAELRSRGIIAFPSKPVQTGCVNDIAPDLRFAMETAGIQAPAEQMKELSPLRFEQPCSPHLAAELAGTPINIHELAAKMKKLEVRYGPLIAEGAGGVMVPMGPGNTMLDFMRELGWPVVLVSTDRLGTINHTLLSISAIKDHGLELAGVVINHSAPPSKLISASNTRAIREYGAVSILGEVRYSPDVFPYESFRSICDNLEGRLLK